MTFAYFCLVKGSKPRVEMGKDLYCQNIGRRVRYYRKRAGITLTALAYATDMEKASLSRIETGKANTTVVTLHRIAGAVGVPVYVFFTDFEVFSL